MRKATGVVVAAWGVAAVALCAAACAGSDKNNGGSPEGGANSNPDSSITPEDGGATGQPAGDSAAPPPPPSKDSSVLKAIGSPCSAGTDCASGTCDTSVPNGMCTKACATDTDCDEKGNSTGAACIDSMCFEFCKQVPDSGVPDGGKIELPCKNKAFICVAEPNESKPLCVPNPDAGSSSEAGAEEASTPTNDATADAPPTD